MGNPNHDPKTGEFSSGGGGPSHGGNASFVKLKALGKSKAIEAVRSQRVKAGLNPHTSTKPQYEVRSDGRTYNRNGLLMTGMVGLKSTSEHVSDLIKSGVPVSQIFGGPRQVPTKHVHHDPGIASSEQLNTMPFDKYVQQTGRMTKTEQDVADLRRFEHKFKRGR